MQDNSPCHKTKKEAAFLQSNHIKILHWPPQSPYINPIENLWSMIKRKRQKEYGSQRIRRPGPKNLEGN
jgi:transposase